MPAIGSNRQKQSNRLELFLQEKYKIDFEINNSINPRTMTKFLKKDQLNCNWYEIDAKNAVVGRLATLISKIIT